MAQHRIPLVLGALVAVAGAAQAQNNTWPPILVNDNNPITPAKVKLGKALFWDEQLSATGTTACGTCHIPEAGSSDPRSVPSFPGNMHPGKDGVFGTGDDVMASPGVVRNLPDGSYEADGTFGLHAQVTPRTANSVINAAFSDFLFWDGRADQILRDPMTDQVVLSYSAVLENQAIAPPINEVEMGALGVDWSQIAARLAGVAPLALAESIPAELDQWIADRGYPELFAEVFGTPEVTPTRIAMALATYERTQISNQAPIDAYWAGTQDALTQQERDGLVLFGSGETNCRSCHKLATFSDDDFHWTGVRPWNDDLGRYEITGQAIHKGAMRTPSLRNVGLRKAYFRNGGFTTLEEVVEFYNRGGDFDGPNKSFFIRPLGLSESQKAALVAFMRNALTDPRVEQALPPFDRPLLYTESAHVPVLEGNAVPGSGGHAPRMIALEPPKLGNANLTLAVDGGLGGAPAFLVLGYGADPTAGLLKGGALALTTPARVVMAHGPLNGDGPGEGWGSLSIALPDDPSMLGAELFARWLVVDPAAQRGMAASETAKLTLF